MVRKFATSFAHFTRLFFVLESISDTPVNDNATYVCKECEKSFYEFDEMFEKVMEQKAELSKQIKESRDFIALEPVDIKCEVESTDEMESEDEENLLIPHDVTVSYVKNPEVITDQTAATVDIKPNVSIPQSTQVITHLVTIEDKVNGLNEKVDMILTALKLNASNAVKTQENLKAFESDMRTCKTFIKNTLETKIGKKPLTYPETTQSKNLEELRQMDVALKNVDNANYFVSVLHLYRKFISRSFKKLFLLSHRNAT